MLVYEPWLKRAHRMLLLVETTHTHTQEHTFTKKTRANYHFKQHKQVEKFRRNHFSLASACVYLFFAFFGLCAGFFDHFSGAAAQMHIRHTSLRLLRERMNAIDNEANIKLQLLAQ